MNLEMLVQELQAKNKKLESRVEELETENGRLKNIPPLFHDESPLSIDTASLYSSISKSLTESAVLVFAVYDSMISPLYNIS